MKTFLISWLAAQVPLASWLGKVLKFHALLLILSLLSSRVEAGPLRAASWATLVGGNAADVRTTYVNLPMGGGHCVEGNSGFYDSATPTLTRLVVGKLIIAAPVGALSVVLDKQGKHTAANVFRFIGGGSGASAAAWNVTRSCR